MSVIKKYLEDSDTPASVLAVICNDLLTEDFLHYEIEAVVDVLQSTFDVELPIDNVDKIQAIQSIYTTNGFFMDIPIFLAVVDAFNGNGIDFNYVDIPQVSEVALAIVEVLMNDPDQDMENLFTPDIEVFIRKLLEAEGFSQIPPSLAFLKEVKVYSTKDTILDDPIIYEAHYQMQQEKVNEIEDYVASHVMRIVHALDELPLKNRDESSWGKFMKSL